MNNVIKCLFLSNGYGSLAMHEFLEEKLFLEKDLSIDVSRYPIGNETYQFIIMDASYVYNDIYTLEEFSSFGAKKLIVIACDKQKFLKWFQGEKQKSFDAIFHSTVCKQMDETIETMLWEDEKLSETAKIFIKEFENEFK